MIPKTAPLSPPPHLTRSLPLPALRVAAARVGDAEHPELRQLLVRELRRDVGDAPRQLVVVVLEVEVAQPARRRDLGGDRAGEAVAAFTQADVDAARQAGIDSVTPEDGVTQADVDAAKQEVCDASGGTWNGDLCMAGWKICPPGYYTCEAACGGLTPGPPGCFSDACFGYGMFN